MAEAHAAVDRARRALHRIGRGVGRAILELEADDPLDADAHRQRGCGSAPRAPARARRPARRRRARRSAPRPCRPSPGARRRRRRRSRRRRLPSRPADSCRSASGSRRRRRSRGSTAQAGAREQIVELRRLARFVDHLILLAERIVQRGRRRREPARAGRGHVEAILEPDAELAGQVEAGLVREAHAGARAASSRHGRG